MSQQYTVDILTSANLGPLQNLRVETIAQYEAVVRLRAQLEAQQRNLATGSDAQRNAAAAVQILTSKLGEQSAALVYAQDQHRQMAATLARSGGASQQAAAQMHTQQARNIGRQLGQDVDGPIARAKESLGQFHAAYKNAGGGLSGLHDALEAGAGSWLAWGYAAKKTVDIGREAVREFEQLQDAMVRMDSALVANGQYSEATSEKYRELADQLANVSGIGGERWLGVLTRLTQHGAPTEGIENYGMAVRNLAAIMGSSPERAAMMLSRVMEGNSRMLKKWGIDVTQSGDKAKELAEAIALINTKGAPLADAAGKTLSGMTRTLGVQFSNLKEQIGQFVAGFIGLDKLLFGAGKAMEWLNEKVNDLGKAWRSLPEWIQDLIPSLQKITLENDRNAAAADKVKKAEQDHANQLRENKTAAEEAAAATKEYVAELNAEIAAQMELVDAELKLKLAQIDADEKSGKINKVQAEQQRQAARTKADNEKYQLKVAKKEAEVFEAAEEFKQAQQEASEFFGGKDKAEKRRDAAEKIAAAKAGREGPGREAGIAAAYAEYELDRESNRDLEEDGAVMMTKAEANAFLEEDKNGKRTRELRKNLQKTGGALSRKQKELGTMPRARAMTAEADRIGDQSKLDTLNAGFVPDNEAKKLELRNAEIELKLRERMSPVQRQAMVEERRNNQQTIGLWKQAGARANATASGNPVAAQIEAVKLQAGVADANKANEPRRDRPQYDINTFDRPAPPPIAIPTGASGVPAPARVTPRVGQFTHGAPSLPAGPVVPLPVQTPVQTPKTASGVPVGIPGAAAPAVAGGFSSEVTLKSPIPLPVVIVGGGGGAAGVSRNIIGGDLIPSGGGGGQSPSGPSPGGGAPSQTVYPGGAVVPANTGSIPSGPGGGPGGGSSSQPLGNPKGISSGGTAPVNPPAGPAPLVPKATRNAPSTPKGDSSTSGGDKPHDEHGENPLGSAMAGGVVGDAMLGAVGKSVLDGRAAVAANTAVEARQAAIGAKTPLASGNAPMQAGRYAAASQLGQAAKEAEALAARAAANAGLKSGGIVDAAKGLVKSLPGAQAAEKVVEAGGKMMTATKAATPLLTKGVSAVGTAAKSGLGAAGKAAGPAALLLDYALDKKTFDADTDKFAKSESPREDYWKNLGSVQGRKWKSGGSFEENADALGFEWYDRKATGGGWAGNLATNILGNTFNALSIPGRMVGKSASVFSGFWDAGSEIVNERGWNGFAEKPGGRSGELNEKLRVASLRGANAMLYAQSPEGREYLQANGLVFNADTNRIVSAKSAVVNQGEKQAKAEQEKAKAAAEAERNKPFDERKKTLDAQRQWMKDNAGLLTPHRRDELTLKLAAAQNKLEEDRVASDLKDGGASDEFIAQDRKDNFDNKKYLDSIGPEGSPLRKRVEFAQAAHQKRKNEAAAFAARTAKVNNDRADKRLAKFGHPDDGMDFGDEPKTETASASPATPEEHPASPEPVVSAPETAEPVLASFPEPEQPAAEPPATPEPSTANAQAFADEKKRRNAIPPVVEPEPFATQLDPDAEPETPAERQAKLLATVNAGIPARAEGGPVVSGRTHLVGEEGPELFVPKSDGTIIPNDEMGGSADGVAESVSGVRQSGGELVKGMMDMSKAAMRANQETLASMREFIAMQQAQGRELEELRAYVRNGR